MFVNRLTLIKTPISSFPMHWYETILLIVELIIRCRTGNYIVDKKFNAAQERV